MRESEPDWQEVDPSVLHTAENLIELHHPRLTTARICFVFRKTAQSSKGRKVLAHVSTIPAKEQVFLEYDFLAWVSKEDWERLSQEKREALIDHELCHMTINNQNIWSIIGHDIEEFVAVIKRHGNWNRSLQEAEAALAEFGVQLGLQYAGKNGGKVGTISSTQLKNHPPEEIEANEDEEEAEGWFVSTENKFVE
jgi:hypothetical protein